MRGAVRSTCGSVAPGDHLAVCGGGLGRVLVTASAKAQLPLFGSGQDAGVDVAGGRVGLGGTDFGECGGATHVSTLGGGVGDVSQEQRVSDPGGCFFFGFAAQDGYGVVVVALARGRQVRGEVERVAVVQIGVFQRQRVHLDGRSCWWPRKA
ncbi:hypothetical protein [Streptomyces sp. 891-h]|uniref:hypothetical protein n=1 Tax=Streptomyces sp. 891-h TaxID=2720714 RepID=UPI001FAA6316|nr:hypothetical protein [Streptomyces sp. 891-h]UNZ21357.1 hypothetical protein HC362_34205 [Streptomyces sp. 891-h]